MLNLLQNLALDITSAQIFAPPPHLFDATHLGFLSVFKFVFAILGALLGFFLSDSFPKFATRRNNGIFEPEFRLILFIPVLLIGVPGLFGFGFYIDRTNITWQAASCLEGLLEFAGVLSGTLAYAYVLDAHRNLSIEVNVAMNVMRQFFVFGSSYFLPAWLSKQRTWKVFSAIGGLQLGVTLLTLVVWRYGKVWREIIARKDPLKAVGLAG